MGYASRAYQDAAVANTRAKLKARHKRPLLVAPTGSGKTIIACRIVEGAAGKKKRVLFITHRRELVDQISATLTEVGIEHGILQGDRTRNADRPIVVASIQTLTKRLAKPDHGIGPFDLVILDEAHHATADSYRAALDAFPNAPVLGLTATPYRADGTPLGDIFDSIVEVSTIKDLIALGFLVPPRVFERKAPADLARVKKSEMTHDYDLKDLARVMDRIELVEDIVAAWKEIGKGRKTVVFAVSVAHSLHLRDAFLRAGIRAGHVDGNMKPKARAAEIARLVAGEIDVLCNCNILTEGWDMPACACIVLARPTRSRSLWKQMCGRALRPDTGKVDCLILDHAGCKKRFGLLTDPDKVSLTGRESEGEAPSFHCPFCAAELEGWPSACPFCGKELPRGARGGPDAKPAVGPMVEVSTEAAQQAERVRFYVHTAEVALAHDKTPGWIAGKFLGRFGRYPKRSDMGMDPALWTQHDEHAKKRVWVRRLSEERLTA